MTESYVQERIKEIYDAYEQNPKTDGYKIRMCPINGHGDIQVEFIKGTKIRDRIIREIVIKKEDDLKAIQLWDG